jgi:hypothetical protein
MFQLFTSHHPTEELKNFFYKRVLHMKWFSSLRDPIRLYTICLAERYVKSKVIDKIKV